MTQDNEQRAKYLREWRRRNPKRAVEHQLRARYGITTKERDELLRRQRGRCAGCRRHPGWRMVVDHNHKTKKIRGILCHHCNLVLGHAKDNPNTLRRLACYLEK